MKYHASPDLCSKRCPDPGAGLGSQMEEGKEDKGRDGHPTHRETLRTTAKAIKNPLANISLQIREPSLSLHYPRDISRRGEASRFQGKMRRLGAA